MRATFLFLLCACCAAAQTTGATFGKVLRLGGTPSDIVLDEGRHYLYLVTQTTNSVQVFDYEAGQVVNAIGTGNLPVAAAMSMDGSYLYVTNNQDSSVSVIDLNREGVIDTVALAAKPEGIEVGSNGNVLITTEGTSTTDQVNSLVLYSPGADGSQQVTPVTFAPPPPTPTTLGTTTTTRPVTTFRGKLRRTPDGNFIIGLSTVNSNVSTILFVYEVASGTILRSRTVTGQSTVLTVSADGATFMAGFTLYDTVSLSVVAQQNTAAIPFPLSSTGAAFNTLQNVGGAVFSPDGATVYSAFNVAPFSNPATRPQASTLLISDARNLGVSMGIKVPESIVSKMVMLSDSSRAWGLSESGLIELPLSELFDYPILESETTSVFLPTDDCNRGVVQKAVAITNRGKGKLTFSVPDTGAALVAQVNTGLAPAKLTFMTEPGRTNITRQPGTNLYSGTSTNSGTAVAVNLVSPEAINIPKTIRVYMNYRQSDQRGVVFPIPTTATVTEGLQDIVVDEARDKVYITNSGYNRIEVFDRAKQQMVDPIPTVQMPHQMAIGGDGRTLYVASAGGELIGKVDLDTGKDLGYVTTPAYPRSGNANPSTPQSIAWTLFGIQVLKSDGTQWKVVQDQMSPRSTNSVTPTQLNTTTSPRIVADPSGQWAMAVAGNGTAYLYNGLSDAYTVSNRPYSSTTIQGYYGPAAAGPQGNYFLLGGLILNSALATVGGSESPSSTQTTLFASTRNIAAVAPVDGSRFVRMTTPVKQSVASTATGDARTTLELVDLQKGSVSNIGALAENPVQSAFGTSRINVPSRQLAVDAKGNIYAITLSGLTVLPMSVAGTLKPQVTAMEVGKPGDFVSISGANLAAGASAVQMPAPTVLGGSCVTLSNVALPLFETSGSKILAQIPGDLSPGSYVLQVRSLATGQQSNVSVVTVQK